MASEPLNLVRVRVDTARLLREGLRMRLPMQDVDLGYLLHAWLEGTFGPGVLRPFAIGDADARFAEVLGYSTRGEAALREHADTFAPPELHAAADWPSLAVKAMPSAWAPGRRLGFKVTLCPTLRRSGARPTAQRGEEVDAFLAAAWREPDQPKPDREAVYLAWLRERLEGHGVALEWAGMTHFQIATHLRRTQGAQRKGKPLQLPRATMEGVLTVTDGAAFEALLAHGVGRHRAFGYGMLLLTPPRAI